jgi:hypothetical protein
VRFGMDSAAPAACTTGILGKKLLPELSRTEPAAEIRTAG